MKLDEMAAQQAKKLTPKQLRAIECLLISPTTAQAAQAAGVSTATLFRWLSSESDFADAYRQAREQLLESALTALQSSAGLAVETLRDVMNDEKARAAERVSAARSVLEFSLKAREQFETEARLRDLEDRLVQFVPQK